MKVSAQELVYYLSRAIQPESNWDVFLSAVLFLVLSLTLYHTLTKLGLITPTKRGLLTLTIALLLLSALYCIAIISVVPRCARFPNTKIGIVLPRIRGGDLTKHIGSRNLNEKIEFELTAKFEAMGLSNYVEARAVSWTARNLEGLEQIEDKYNASAGLCGDYAVIENTAELSFIFDAGHVMYTTSLPTTDTVSLTFRCVAAPDFTIRFGDNTYNLGLMISQIVEDITPLVAARTYALNSQLSENLILSLPEINPRSKIPEYNAFFIKVQGDALSNRGRFAEAMDKYALAYDWFGRLKLQNDRQRLPVHFSDTTLRRFAAAAKYREGELAFESGDTTRTIQAFKVAAETWKRIEPVCSPVVWLLFYVRLDTVTVPERDKNSPFLSR